MPDATPQTCRPRYRGPVACLAGIVALLAWGAGPARAEPVCWYSVAEKTPEVALAACTKVIDAKGWTNKGFESAVYLSRAMARFGIMAKKRTFPAADIQTTLADLDQSIAANPQEMAHFLRALLYERLSRMTPSERPRYRSLAVREAKAAMAFNTTQADHHYRKIIRDNQ